MLRRKFEIHAEVYVEAFGWHQRRFLPEDAPVLPPQKGWVQCKHTPTVGKDYVKGHAELGVQYNIQPLNGPSIR